MLQDFSLVLVLNCSARCITDPWCLSAHKSVLYAEHFLFNRYCVDVEVVL